MIYEYSKSVSMNSLELIQSGISVKFRFSVSHLTKLDPFNFKL